MLPPGQRLGAVLELIEAHRFFTLRAGRQTGKTTSARWLVEHLNAGGRFHAVWVDVQIAGGQPDPAKAFETLRYCLDMAIARDLSELGPPTGNGHDVAPPSTFLLRYLRDLAARSPRPLVVLFDGADGLVGEAIVSLLTQLRQGYFDRSKTPFPASVVFLACGSSRLAQFNISSEAVTLGAFTEDETAELLAQHTAATGQRFEPEATRRIWELTQGHPWLTNALADQVVRHDVKDRGVSIAPAHVDAAKDAIILEQHSHIALLREPRVKRVLDSMLAGGGLPGDVQDDDICYVIDLGLIRITDGEYQIANPVYREVLTGARPLLPAAS